MDLVLCRNGCGVDHHRALHRRRKLLRAVACGAHLAAFSVIVGIGQMFVITLGPGNIDLCVPATMTLSGTLALKFMDVSDSLILPGLLIAILIGIAIGIGNYALIKLLRIPRS